MLTCREVTSKATEYTEGALPWTTRLQIRLHLMMCWMCRRYLEQLELTTRALRHLAGGDAPTETPAPLREAFRQWTDRRRR
jgi:anti-sigma factor ChrR (cupin superfamily)